MRGLDRNHRWAVWQPAFCRLDPRTQVLRVIFGDRCKTGRLDLEVIASGTAPHASAGWAEGEFRCNGIQVDGAVNRKPVAVQERHRVLSICRR